VNVLNWRTQPGAIARGAPETQDEPIKLGSGYHPGMQSVGPSSYLSLQIIHIMDNLQG
jgi:hypothetical protein